MYLAAGDLGWRVVDVSDPRHPRLIGGGETENALRVTAGDNYLAVADLDRVLTYPLQCSTPFVPRGNGGTADKREKETPISLSARPNPFRFRCRIELPGEKAAVTAAAVYDLQGKLVRKWEPSSPVGSLVWDGRDAAGRRLPAGVYLARVQAGGTWRSARLVLLR